MTARLAGEVAIVTGSTSGLGREVARVMGAEGASVVVTGRDAARGAATVALVEEAGGEAAFVAADLASDGAADDLVRAAVDAFGAVTVVVNNAVGTASDGPAGALSDDALRRILDVNLVAAVALCRAAIPRMLEVGRGAIVNVSSRAAGRGTPGLAGYTVSKAGLEALARSITIDYGRQGVRCNNVQPGYILHEGRDAELSAERRADLEGRQLTRLTTATDVAWAIVYLASREAEVVSGITLRVDGGSSAVRGRTLG